MYKSSYMSKLLSIYRRFRLGARFKHQYNCHPDFSLVRGSDTCAVRWKKQEIATIPYARQLTDKFSSACFIIATGPSLAAVDLRAIAGFDTISLNCAIKKFSDAGMKPTHCVIVDHRVFERQWDCVKASILSGTNCFFSYDGLSRICEREPGLLKQGNIFLIESISRKFAIARPTLEECQADFFNDPQLFVDENASAYCRSVGFSTSLEKGLFSGKTVATWAAQLAYCLGYRQQFIIGMDLGGTGKKHFYADGSNPSPDFLKDYEPYIRVCFEQARRASLQKGFDIYNLSKESTLPGEIIPKISIEEALQLAKK